MKIAMDERLKHRVVGFAVLLALGVIFAPILLKQSNQSFEEKSTVLITLPPKPSVSKVAIPTKQKMFDTIKVAHVEIPPLPVETNSPSERIVKAEPLSEKTRENKSQSIRVGAQQPYPSKTLVSTNKINAPLKATPTETSKKIPLKNGYAVQLALFAEQKNAIALVNRLKSKGYKATYIHVNNGKNRGYKVIVGKLAEKQEALNLQRQLASVVQIKGFIIQTEIS